MKLATLALLAACQSPFVPDGAVRVTPPAVYRIWWEASRDCIHKPEYVSYEAVTWYVSPDIIETPDGTMALGLTVGTRIYLWAEVQGTPWIIQHELAHAINRLPAHPHPADPFVRCGLLP